MNENIKCLYCWFYGSDYELIEENVKYDGQNIIKSVKYLRIRDRTTDTVEIFYTNGRLGNVVRNQSRNPKDFFVGKELRCLLN